MTDSKAHFHIPTRPYSPIDALNRRAAAIGSPGYAMKASRADYNGHHVIVSWNNYRQHYVCYYTWAGPVVLARGTAYDCIATAIREYERGALGASVAITLREVDATIGGMFSHTATKLVSGIEPREPEWRTWMHSTAEQCARDSARGGMPALIFDWPLMQQANSEEEYSQALKAKYGRRYQ